MKNKIIPSLIAKSQKELNKRFKKVKDISKNFQLDIMDGKFVKNKSLNFNFKIPKGKNKYEAHLMIKNPEKWISKNAKKVNIIIFHVESTKNPDKLISFIKSKRKKVGVAINPKTPLSKITRFLSRVELVLIMTVNPGKYGSKFLPETLKKVKQLRKLKPKLSIEVDGGINNKTISRTKVAGANRFVVGSYLQESKDVGKVYKKLHKN